MIRKVLLAAMTIALLNLFAVMAFAASEAELRHVDTQNVVEATDIEASGVGAEEGQEAEAAPKAEGHEEEAEAESEAHGEEGAAAGEEAHHPAWMFTGWQTLFAVIAVLYYAVALTILPSFMAKEEGGHH